MIFSHDPDYFVDSRIRYIKVQCFAGILSRTVIQTYMIMIVLKISEV